MIYRYGYSAFPTDLFHDLKKLTYVGACMPSGKQSSHVTPGSNSHEVILNF